MSLEQLEQEYINAGANLETLKQHWSTLRQIQDNRLGYEIAAINAVYIESKIPDLEQYTDRCASTIESFVKKIERNEQLHEREATLLKNMLDIQYVLAICPINITVNRVDIFTKLKSYTAHGSICLYEEFNKTSSLIHNLFVANMIDPMKEVLSYLITSPNNLEGHRSYKQACSLNINPDCYGLFGPALKSEQDIRDMWDAATHKWNDTTSYVAFSGHNPHKTYHVGHGAAIQSSTIHTKFFNLDEVLAYRQSIHTFFGDLMQLCVIDSTALDTLVLPVLQLLVRGEASITREFIDTIFEYVPENAREAAMKVAGKFVEKTKVEEPEENSDDALAIASDLSSAPKETVIAKPTHQGIIRPVAIINACDTADSNETVLNAMSNGDFVTTVREFIDTNTGNTLLHIAALHGKVKAITKIIEAGGDLDATNNAGHRPIELVPKDNLDAINAFQGSGDGRMTPISREYRTYLHKIASQDLDLSNATLEDLMEHVSRCAQDLEGLKNLSIITSSRYSLDNTLKKLDELDSLLTTDQALETLLKTLHNGSDVLCDLETETRIFATQLDVDHLGSISDNLFE